MSTTVQDVYTIESFEASDVDPTLFNHEAHVYVGWLYVTTYECTEAFVKFDAALRRLTQKVGATDKYNGMITWLFLLLIDERAQEGETWPTFRARNSDLLEGRPRQAVA